LWDVPYSFNGVVKYIQSSKTIRKMERKMETLITIIVPAYNVEKYIRECVNSLIHQTRMKHKIVIVNDGSTDRTEEVCMELKKDHGELITYVSQENQGLGGARNTGMKYVDTPYLCFLDSDDWLNSYFVECFSKMIERTDELPDLVFTLPWVYDSVTKCVMEWKDKKLYDQIFEASDGSSKVVTNARKRPELYALEVNACRKIYKTAFLKEQEFQFPLKLKWEDVPGHFQLLHEANTCMALPEVGFFYRVNQGGQITSGGGASRLDMLPIFKLLLKVQEKYDFNNVEKAYALRVIIEFSRWSVEVTNQDYIGKLLDGLHELYQTFSQENIDYYLKNISDDKKREEGFISCLRGHEYKKLSDYRSEEMGKYVFIENSQNGTGSKRKGLLRGGIQCVCDHGISYTLILMCKKYLHRNR
jgi:epsG